jgi:hypothetical protein
VINSAWWARLEQTTRFQSGSPEEGTVLHRMEALWSNRISLSYGANLYIGATDWIDNTYFGSTTQLMRIPFYCSGLFGTINDWNRRPLEMRRMDIGDEYNMGEFFTDLVNGNLNVGVMPRMPRIYEDESGWWNYVKHFWGGGRGCVELSNLGYMDNSRKFDNNGKIFPLVMENWDSTTLTNIRRAVYINRLSAIGTWTGPDVNTVVSWPIMPVDIAWDYFLEAGIFWKGVLKSGIYLWDMVNWIHDPIKTDDYPYIRPALDMRKRRVGIRKTKVQVINAESGGKIYNKDGEL